MSTVLVADPGNAADLDEFGSPSHGAVNYNYRIGKYEVTNSQYAEFLNAAAASDPYGLFNPTMASNARGGITRSGSSGSYSYAVKSNMGDKPVNYVSLFDAMRFSNWMHNGQGAGSTENGAYPLNGVAVPVALSPLDRQAGAKWFLPTQDEWHKAAYYQPSAAGGDVDGYWHYATRSNTLPTQAIVNSPTPDIANPGFNVANYDLGVGFQTTVGTAGPLSRSYYGTYDQSGNVEEWTDATGDPNTYNTYAVYRRGGSYNESLAGPGYNISAYGALYSFSTTELSYVGFRMATVPEPGSLAIAIAGCLLVGGWGAARRQNRRN
jgi:formylglycine-generating enzyme required for sulfatase activity